MINIIESVPIHIFTSHPTCISLTLLKAILSLVSISWKTQVQPLWSLSELFSQVQSIILSICSIKFPKTPVKLVSRCWSLPHRENNETESVFKTKARILVWVYYSTSHTKTITPFNRFLKLCAFQHLEDKTFSPKLQFHFFLVTSASISVLNTPTFTILAYHILECSCNISSNFDHITLSVANRTEMPILFDNSLTIHTHRSTCPWYPICSNQYQVKLTWYTLFRLIHWSLWHWKNPLNSNTLKNLVMILLFHIS